MDDDVHAIRVVTNTGGADTGDTAPVPHTDITIGDTNNPDSTHGVMPTGSNTNGTLVVNSDIAASPTLEVTTMGPNNDTLTVNFDIAASPTLEEIATSAVGAGSHDDTHIVDSGTAASPTLKHKQPSQTTEPTGNSFPLPVAISDGMDTNISSKKATSFGRTSTCSS